MKYITWPVRSALRTTASRLANARLWVRIHRPDSARPEQARLYARNQDH